MQNNWQVGALYPNGGLNNIAWSQPGGPGTIVYPQQQIGGAYESITPFNEATGMFRAGCGHAMNQALVQREYDYDNDISVALVTCPLCGYVQYSLSPFESALDTVYQPWLVI